MVFDVILLILLVAALVPYVLGPVLVRLQQKQPARPGLEPYDPTGHTMREDVAAAFRRTIDILAPGEFRVAADLFHVGDLTKLVLRIALLERDNAEQAIVVGTHSTDPKSRASACYVECFTKFVGGGTLLVNNNTQPTVFGRVAHKRVECFPQVRDPARIVAIHRALVHRSPEHTLPIDGMGEPVGFLIGATVRELEQQVGTGYLWLDRPAQVYRPTWKGALLMSWKLLPPMSQIRAVIARRRAAARLRELGLEGPDQRPVAAPASPDPLRWNFVALLAVVLAYVIAPDALRSGLGFGPAPESFSVPAGFSVPDDFPGAVDALKRLTGDTAAPLIGTDSLGTEITTAGFTVGVGAARAEALIEAVQRLFLAQGFYLFRSEQHLGIQGQRDRVALYPGRDPYEILRLLGTNGWNFGIGPDSIVAWLRSLERDHPFVLTGIGFDWLAGRFIAEIPDAGAAELARRFHAFCPDIVEQGTGSIVALARELRTTRQLYCWWD